MSLLLGTTKFEQNFGILGGYVDGYKKLKSIIKLLEDKMPKTERYEWDCDLFGPESSEMLYEIDYELSKGYIGSNLDCTSLAKKQPIHHNYFMNFTTLQAFMSHSKYLFKEIKENKSKPEELITEAACWLALPTSYSVSQTISKSKESNIKESKKLGMDMPYDSIKKEVVKDMEEWYKDAGFSTELNNISLTIHMKDSKIEDLVRERYAYLSVKDVEEKEINKNLNMILSGMRYLVEIPYDKLKEKCEAKINSIIEDTTDKKDTLNKNVSEKLNYLNGVLKKLREDGNDVLIGFEVNGKTTVTQEISYPINNKDMRYLWHIFQPAEAYSLFEQIPYAELSKIR